MNGRNWVIAAIITVSILALVAFVLVGVLVFQTLQNTDVMDAFRDIPVEAPREEQVEVPVEGPAVIKPVDVDGAVGILIIDDGDNNMRILDRFARTCEAYGVPYNSFTGNGDPKELLEAGMAMLESGVTGLVVQSLDPEISAVLADRGNELGVPVITLNAGWNVPHSGNEALHISAWGSGEEIGTNLMLTAADIAGSKSNVVLLMPSGHDPIVDTMIMVHESWPELKDMTIVATGDAEDNPDRCRELVYKLTEAHMPDAFVCADPMTTDIAIQAMMEMGMETPVIGYASPREMAAHSYSNAVGLFQDPYSLGELAASSIVGLVTGDLTMKEGEVVVISTGEGYVVELQDGVPHMHVNPVYIDWSNADALLERY